MKSNDRQITYMVSSTTKVMLGAFLIFYALQNDGGLTWPFSFNWQPSFFNLTFILGVLIIILLLLKVKICSLFILIGGLTTLNALSLLNSTPPVPTPVPTSITTTTHQYCAKCAEAHQQCPKSKDRPSDKNSTTSDPSCKDCCITTEKTSLSIPSSSSYLPPWFILTSGLVLLIIGGIASGERESSKK